MAIKVIGKDCYINWYVGECDDEEYVMYGDNEDAAQRTVDTWLRQQSPELDDEVLIKHWW